MVTIRPATIDDWFALQHGNLINLPENYTLQYYYYHLTSWPQLIQVAEDWQQNIVGYVLAKVDEEDNGSRHGHITSLGVSRSHRKLGIATRLMTAAHEAMMDIGCEFCSLHVRVTNIAAFTLYSKALKYDIVETDVGYYADKEDAYAMRKMFPLGLEKKKEREERKKAKK